MLNPSRRLGALAVSSALALSGLALVASPAHAVGTDPRPVTIGADWLAGELVDGLLPGDFGPLYGPSIDAALALKLAGGHAADVQAVGDGLADAIDSYIDFSYAYDSDGDEVDETYTGEAAGPTAKALVLAQNLAVPTTTLGGVDLLARVEGYVAPDAPIAGRLVGVALKDGDPDPFGEYTNVIGQALGAAALHTAGSDEAGPARDFLLQQQCAAGYFRLDFNFDKTALDQTCDGADPASNPADPDVTAQVVRLLQPQAAGNATVEAALEKAEDWLIARQRADGSFVGGTSTAVPNANSTGLIGSALGLRGETAAATKAAVWLRAHQADELASCPNALSTETGAIAYGDDELAEGRASGIGSSAQQWRIAATQALGALAYAPSATRDLELTGPTTVKGGSKAYYTVGGAVPGDKVCVTALGVGRPVAARADGTARIGITMPTTTGTRTIKVRDRAATTVARQILVLAAKTLAVSVPTSVKRGATVPVRVSGLYPGESVRITVNWQTVRTGFANSQGVFVSSFTARKTLGTYAVRAYGRYADIRRGYDSFKVVG